MAGQGIAPLQAGKPGEVAVRGTEVAVVFHGHRGQMGVRDEIAGRAPSVQHLLKEMPVVFGGMKQVDARLIEPALHALARLIQGERALMQSRVGRNADEGRQHRPTKAHRFGAGKLFVPPGTRRRMGGTERQSSA